MSAISDSLSDIPLSLAEILASLSYALDLTSGQPTGHAERTCLIGLRLADEIGVSQEQLTALYHALLLKDAGCSSNAARMYQLFGSDDIEAKRVSKVVDWSNLIEAGKYAASHVLPSGPFLKRAARLLHVATHQSESSDGMMAIRCERGAQIAMDLGLGPLAAECIRGLDEHWNGRGGPEHLKGEQISLLSRIACLAQTLEVYAQTFGLEAGYEIVRKRSGKWFDPELVKAAHGFRDDEAFWTGLRNSPRERLLSLDIRATVETATESRIDSVCDAFAQVIDAKSPFTGEHSVRVCRYAVEIAEGLRFDTARMTVLRRAALLHDIGKLSVSNTILDKPDKLDDREWTIVRNHTVYTEKILSQIRGFERLTEIAAAHHERLDGRGYHKGLRADELDLDMRILAVADVFDALSADRPYRAALPLDRVFAILEKDAEVALDRECINTLRSRYAGREFAHEAEASHWKWAA